MATAVAFARMLAANGSDSATVVGTAARKQSAQALRVQSYALSALRQSNVNLAGFANLKSLETDINNAIGQAKGNAQLYLDTLLPKAITVIVNIDGYFNLQNALADALTPGTDAKTAIQLLQAVQDQLTPFQRQASGLVSDFQNLRTNLSSDASNFARLASSLNDAVNGDKGVLADIDSQLSGIDGKIAGAITGTVLSGLAIFGGIFMICVGAIAEFVTAGTSTPLVIAGIGVVAAGVGGEVASSITLANLIKMKNGLLMDKSRLTSEVNLALGMKSGYQSLADSAGDAAAASQEMANAWNLLSDDLGTLITNVSKGRTTVDVLRLLYQKAAQGTVKTVQGDIATIKGQLSGVQTVDSKPGETVNQTILRVAQEHKKAA